MKNNKKILIFDFDGTIADSFDEIIDILNYFGKENGLEEIGEKGKEEIKRMTSRQFFDKFSHSQSKMKLIYLIWKAKKILGERLNRVEAFSSMPKILNELKNEGITMGILTSNSKDNIEKFLEREDMNYFDFIFSSRLFGKAEKLKKISKKYKFEKQDIFYIGDETRDIEAAKEAGMKSVAVTWGFNAREVLEKLNPDYFIEKPEDLLSLLD